MIRMTLVDDWITLILAFCDWQRAGGSPETTITARRQHLTHMARRIGQTPDTVTTDCLIAYMSAQTWAPETRRGRRQTFMRFWSWAAADGRLPGDVARSLPRVRAADARPRPASDAAYSAALLRADRRVRLMLRLSAEIGLRRAEVAQVHARDLLDDLGGVTLVVHGKGRKVRHVPLPAGLAIELREQCEAAGWAFPGADQGHLSPRWTGKLVGRLLPEGVTMHALRHRFASRAWAQGVDVFVLQTILGHASPATTRRYVAVPNTAARAAIDLLAA